MKNIKDKDLEQPIQQSPTLPVSNHCSAIFCNKIPLCITSYEPNLGLRLQDHLHLPAKSVSGNDSHIRLGTAHYGNNPDFQLKDVENRYAPLGYMDRKFGYVLKGRKDKTRIKAVMEDDNTGLPFVDISFQSKGDGSPLILCEPPCFIDQCPTKRVMPIIQNVTISIDEREVVYGKEYEQLSRLPEIGKYCYLIQRDVAKGNHILRIATDIKDPYFVMFSHVISFQSIVNGHR